MNARKNRWKCGALARSVMLLPALVVGIGLAFAGAASAQTTFQADVTAKSTKPSGGCSNGAFSCGTANIAGYGAGSWDLFLAGNTNVPTSCGSTYTAVTYFTLATDGSTLALDEGGYLCAPGMNGNGYFKEGLKAWGYPYTALGTWTIDTADSSGVFGNLQGCGTDPNTQQPIPCGTDTLYYAGAQATGSYSGTLR
jgi:hypothetical protein